MKIIKKITMLFSRDEAKRIEYHTEKLITILDKYSKKISGVKCIYVYYDYSHEEKRNVSVHNENKEFQYVSDKTNHNFNPNEKIF